MHFPSYRFVPATVLGLAIALPLASANAANMPSRLDGTLPGFHPALKPVALDPVDAELASLDLTVCAFGKHGSQTGIRLATADGAISPEGRFLLSAGEGSDYCELEYSATKGALLRSWKDGEQNERQLAVDRQQMKGSPVFELWLSSELLAGTSLAAGPSRIATMLEGRLVDEMLADASRDGSRTDHHVAFVHHGNQGLTWTDVLWGHESYSHEQHWADYLDTASEHNGFDELLGLHDVLDVPANFQIAGPLQTAAEWYYPTGGTVEGFNEWVARGVSEGWAAILASAYAQHIMPFSNDSMNNWSVHVHADMCEWRYGYTPHVAWVPERVWVSPTDNDGNAWDTSPHVNDWIGDNWLPHGIYGVILDQGEHCGYQDNWSNDRHIYSINVPDQGDLKIVPISGGFTGNCHHDAGAAWSDILSSSSDELLVYGTDWEVAAEVAGFENSFPSALNNMIWLVQQIAATGGSVASVKLDEVIGGFSGGSINLQNGTYGLLGGLGGYGSDWLSPGTRNSWYGHWASSACHSDQHSPQWNYGTVWNNTWTNLMAAPTNDLSELGWYVLMTNMYETGWHDGEEISGWIHRYASHIKNANVYAEASRWVNGDYTVTTNAYNSDIDMDGQDELVIHNDRVFAVFESVGGRAQWMFVKGPDYDGSVVGSCSAYWVDTEGDYNDNTSSNHIAAFSDVSPTYENDLYSMSVDSVSTDHAEITLSYGTVSKTISLETGNPYLVVDYTTSGDTWIKHGFTPDYMDLLWSAQSDRIWDPAASWPQTDWCGQRNPNTGITAALVLGNGGAEHSSDFQGTILRGDEIKGNGRFRYFFYAGETSEPDAQGHVAELDLLAAQNMDVSAPQLSAVASFLSPNQAILSFSEAVDASTAANVANYTLVGMPGVSVTSAARQADWTRVALDLSGLSSGISGSITVQNVTDTAGNVIDPAYDTASFTMPDGLTPHTILVDGLNDFLPEFEWMDESSDSLFITWDSANLYIGFHGRNLATGDFFVHIDTDLLAASGASRASWGRLGFASANRPEYEICVEGGGNSMQINHWDGSEWQYVQYGTHTGSSYEGWSGNTMSEFSIPWVELGEPEGLAIAASFSAEDSWVTTLSWPESNPTGDDITITDWWIYAEPVIAGPMPLMGIAPNNPGNGGEELDPVDDLQIEYVSATQLRLSWSAVDGASAYNIFASDDAYDFSAELLIDQTSLLEFYVSPLEAKRFYRVVAVD